LLAAAWMTAAGCTVGPDHVAPDLSETVGTAWAAEDAGSGDAGDAASAADLAAWWDRLEDAELSAFVEQALAGNLGLAEARERIVAARARRGIEDAARLPQLDGTASYERLETGEDGLALGGAPGGSGTDVYTLGVIAGWELDLWGRVARLTEAADAEIDVAVEDRRAIRVALAAEVAREVILIRAIDADLALVRETLIADRDTVAIAESRARAGIRDALDASRARRVLETTAALVPALEADRRAGELRLGVLLGRRPGDVRVAVRPLPRRDVVPPLGVPADLLVRRPDVRRAERQLAAATARIGAAEAERYPRISIGGSLALQGPDLGDVVNPDAHVLRFGPSLSVPLFDGGRIDANRQLAESSQREALTRMRRTVLEAMAEVEIAAMRRARTEARAAQLLAAERAAEDTEALSRDRNQAGAVDFLDVTEARRQRLDIARARLAAEREALLRLVELHAALGGGWEVDAAVRTAGRLD
jgi:NodT family efflux transporter outer membrane factor (OMF) lipoprotein